MTPEGSGPASPSTREEGDAALHRARALGRADAVLALYVKREPVHESVARSVISELVVLLREPALPEDAAALPRTQLGEEAVDAVRRLSAALDDALDANAALLAKYGARGAASGVEQLPEGRKPNVESAESGPAPVVSAPAPLPDAPRCPAVGCEKPLGHEGPHEGWLGLTQFRPDAGGGS